jgi:hypothetical protein
MTIKGKKAHPFQENNLAFLRLSSEKDGYNKKISQIRLSYAFLFAIMGINITLVKERLIQVGK